MRIADLKTPNCGFWDVVEFFHFCLAYLVCLVCLVYLVILGERDIRIGNGEGDILWKWAMNNRR